MRMTPNELLGRTSSVSVQIGWGVTPLGSLLAGLLLQELSPSAAMTVVASGMAVTAATATAAAPVSPDLISPDLISPAQRRTPPGRADETGCRTTALPRACCRNARGIRSPRP